MTGDPARPEFVATYDRGKTACIDSISVARGTGTARTTVWGVRRIDRTTPASCVDRIRFGTVPRGYESSFPLRSVNPGQAYEVNASGVSWSAAAVWTAAAGR